MWPLPCASCAKWQSTQCMPYSMCTDSRWTAFANFSGSSVGDDVVVVVEQPALAVVLEDRAEIPAVAVIVGELRVLDLRVQLAVVGGEVFARPLAAHGRAFGIAVEHLALLGDRKMLLLLRPHLRRRRLVVPHGVAEPRVHEEVRLVHVADHALLGRDGVGHHVADRMRRFAVRDGRIDRSRSCRGCRTWHRAPTPRRRGCWHRRRGTRRSRNCDSRPGCRSCP